MCKACARLRYINTKSGFTPYYYCHSCESELYQFLLQGSQRLRILDTAKLWRVQKEEISMLRESIYNDVQKGQISDDHVYKLRIQVELLTQFLIKIDSAKMNYTNGRQLRKILIKQIEHTIEALENFINRLQRWKREGIPQFRQGTIGEAITFTKISV